MPTRPPKSEDRNRYLQELFAAILTLTNEQEFERFFKDLCTPQELMAMAERWRVCQLLEKGNLSYRQIHQQTGTSLATIARVARFLHTEQYQGYTLALSRAKKPRMDTV